MLANRIASDVEGEPYFVRFGDRAPRLYSLWRRYGDEEALRRHLTLAIRGRPERAVALLRAFQPQAWSLETGLPVGSRLERETFDTLAQLVSTKAVLNELIAAFGEAISNSDYSRVSDDQLDKTLAEQFAYLYRHVENEKAVQQPAEGLTNQGPTLADIDEQKQDDQTET